MKVHIEKANCITKNFNPGQPILRHNPVNLLREQKEERGGEGVYFWVPKKKGQGTHKAKEIRLSPDFLTVTLCVRRKWN